MAMQELLRKLSVDQPAKHVLQPMYTYMLAGMIDEVLGKHVNIKSVTLVDHEDAAMDTVSIKVDSDKAHEWLRSTYFAKQMLEQFSVKIAKALKVIADQYGPDTTLSLEISRNPSLQYCPTTHLHEFVMNVGLMLSPVIHEYMEQGDDGYWYYEEEYDDEYEDDDDDWDEYDDWDDWDEYDDWDDWDEYDDWDDE